MSVDPGAATDMRLLAEEGCEGSGSKADSAMQF